MHLDQLANTFHEVIASFQANILFSAALIAILLAVHIVNLSLGYRLNILGIYPRTFHGLLGIFFAPFLHQDFNHLFFNSIPFFILSNLILAEGRSQFYYVSLIVIIVGGFALWMFGKRGIHIGASGVIMGYFGYLLAHAYMDLTATSIILAVLTLYYFGGLVGSLFPSAHKNVSWVGHVFGFLAGLLAVYLS